MKEPISDDSETHGICGPCEEIVVGNYVREAAPFEIAPLNTGADDGGAEMRL